VWTLSGTACGGANRRMSATDSLRRNGFRVVNSDLEKQCTLPGARPGQPPLIKRKGC